MEFIIQHDHEGERPTFLEARVPGVCCAWGYKRESARRYSEAEARELAAGFIATPFYKHERIAAVAA